MSPSENAADLKSRVARVLADEIAPALQLDGSGVEVLDIDAGIVRVRLTGACTGCASTIMTIIMGMEQELRRHFPEIEYLEAVP